MLQICFAALLANVSGMTNVCQTVPAVCFSHTSYGRSNLIPCLWWLANVSDTTVPCRSAVCSPVLRCCMDKELGQSWLLTLLLLLPPLCAYAYQSTLGLTLRWPQSCSPPLRRRARGRTQPYTQRWIVSFLHSRTIGGGLPSEGTSLTIASTPPVSWKPKLTRYVAEELHDIAESRLILFARFHGPHLEHMLG